MYLPIHQTITFTGIYPTRMCRYISIHLKLCMLQGYSLYSVYSSKTLGTTQVPINNEKTLQELIFKTLENIWLKKKAKAEYTVC